MVCPNSPKPTDLATKDGYGRVRTETDSDGYTLTYDYDALDRRTKVTYPDTTFEETTYNRLDAEGHRDRLGRWTRTFHDALRRVTAMRDSLGRTTTYDWCSCGSLDKLIDPNGNATSWERDVQGRVTREIRANGSDTDYAYENTTSRLKSMTDAKGQTKTYAYALDDNMTGIAYTNSQYPTSNVSFTYETAYSRMATMVDGTGTTTYGYRPVGSLGATQVASIDGPLSNDAIAYTYDELGRMATRQINGSANGVSYSYDSLGRITTEANVLGSFVMTYDGVTNRLSSVAYPNNQQTVFAYFNNAGDHRLQDLHNKLSGGATLSRFQYTYDPVGNVKTWSQQRDASPAQVLTLGYDAADQLLTATRNPTDAALVDRFAYAYDKAGNRTAEQLDDVVTQAIYDNMNRLTQTAPGGLLHFRGTTNEPATVTVGGNPATVSSANEFDARVPVPSGTSNVVVVAADYANPANTRTNTYQISQSGVTTTLGYDANGNLTSDGTRAYEYDAENRFLAIVNGTMRSEFTYDGFGRRVRMIEKNGSTTVSDKRFVWNAGEIAEERDGSGSIVAKRFFWGGVQTGATSYLYAKDHLGNVVEMTNAGGAIQARYDYDPWGRRTKTSGTLDADVGFTGHYFHSPSGVHLALYRAYDARLGRWLSPDPLGLAAGPNLYGYVTGNPIRRTDPLGLTPAAPAIVIVLGCSPDPFTKVLLAVLLAMGVIVSVAYICETACKPKTPPATPPKSRDCMKEYWERYQGCLKDYITEPETRLLCIELAKTMYELCIAGQ